MAILCSKEYQTEMWTYSVTVIYSDLWYTHSEECLLKIRKQELLANFSSIIKKLVLVNF